MLTSTLVLGAGQGWAKSILLHPSTRNQFAEFFARKDTFTLGTRNLNAMSQAIDIQSVADSLFAGICNGCQMLSRISTLIPGASAWPTFERNLSEVSLFPLLRVRWLGPCWALGRSESSASPKLLKCAPFYIQACRNCPFPRSSVSGVSISTFKRAWPAHFHVQASLACPFPRSNVPGGPICPRSSVSGISVSTLNHSLTIPSNTKPANVWSKS